ncbi:MAG: Fur family transcriptional regulator [Smithellaceae bacterium]
MKKNISDPSIMETLQQAGITGTPQRLAVLRILQDTDQPLSVGIIREKLETKTSINKVTVYRIISLFKKQGIIRDVLSAGGAIYFEMATSDHPVHPHFSCKNCGTLNCLMPLTFSQARQFFIDSPGNYSVDHIEINISGLCNGCLHATKLQKKSCKKGQG